MSSLFRRQPDATTDNYTDSHVGRGADYDDNFETLPMRALMWELEQRVLREWVASVDAGTVLDLACGTGRITGLLARALPQARVIGVDIAESMLDVARKHAPGVEFIQCDIRGIPAMFPNGSVDLVTAFRFFPNAEEALCTEAASAIDAALRPGGLLMLNNHRNFWSASYLTRRAKPRAAAPGALNSAVLQPFLKGRGYRIMARRSLGITPHSDAGAYGISESLAKGIERANERHLSQLHSAGTNTMWILRKSGRPAGDWAH